MPNLHNESPLNVLHFFQSSFNSVVTTARNFQDGSLLPAAQQSPRRIAPVRRTYNWQADELVISFNMSNIATPTCTRLEPPVTWLAASGARVKVLHSGGCTKDEKSNPKLQKSCTSVIEVSVSRNFAECSLSALRNRGFAREDIYRMLDKGPWTLAFDIPAALPRLFASLQVSDEFMLNQHHFLLVQNNFDDFCRH